MVKNSTSSGAHTGATGSVLLSSLLVQDLKVSRACVAGRLGRGALCFFAVMLLLQMALIGMFYPVGHTRFRELCRSIQGPGPRDW